MRKIAGAPTLLAPALAVMLALGACGPASDANEAAQSSEAIAAKSGMTDVAEAEQAGGQGTGLAACPFRRTHNWRGSVEGGRLLVNGKVDLLMAGFVPTLTKRPSASPGTIAFDLALLPEPSAAVNDTPRYTETGAPNYARAEIYCGGERIAEIAMVHIGS